MATPAPDLHPLQAFQASLVTRHRLTQRAYLGTLRDFLAWLATQPGGNPFHIELLTQTAVQGYLDALKSRGAAPRTRSRAIAALRRNPARQLERPTVVALAPTELSGKQRFVLKSLVERLASARLTTIFTLGYWAGLRVSEVATLRIDHCHINQRAGMITLLDAKGSKTRTLDLPNPARQALWAYLHPEASHAEWELVKSVRFHDLRHDWAHRARQSGWTLERDCRLCRTPDQGWRTRDCHHGTLHLAQSCTTESAPGGHRTSRIWIRGSSVCVGSNRLGRWLSGFSRRHVTATLIDRAITDVINVYAHCALPRFWGTGQRAAADGTKLELARENLISEPHFRFAGDPTHAAHSPLEGPGLLSSEQGRDVSEHRRLVQRDH